MLPATNWVTGELRPGIVGLGEVVVALDRVLLGVEEHADAPAGLEVDDGRLLQRHQRPPIRSRWDHSRRSIAATTLSVRRSMSGGRRIGLGAGSRAGRRRRAASGRGSRPSGCGRFATCGPRASTRGGASRRQHRLASRAACAPAARPTGSRPDRARPPARPGGLAAVGSRAATGRPGSTRRRAASRRADATEGRMTSRTAVATEPASAAISGAPPA